jgi:flagellar motor component MotA
MRVLDLLIATIAGIGTGYYIFNDTFKQLGMKLRQKTKQEVKTLQTNATSQIDNNGTGLRIAVRNNNTNNQNNLRHTSKSDPSDTDESGTEPTVIETKWKWKWN